MNFPENVAEPLRNMFDNGLDEILIFAFIFIFILLTGQKNGSGNEPFGGSILPIIVIGAFILLYSGICRTENNPEQAAVTAA